MRTHEELLALGLPKWPKHYVTGAPLSVEQSKEIIRRTDAFFLYNSGGNNHDYDNWVREQLGMQPDHLDRPVGFSWAQQWEKELQWRQKWGCVETSFVENWWLSSSFVGGPHGWCHPDGAIGFIDNVGKWPGVKDIFDDWKTLAAAFPFLDIGATLFDREECEEGLQKVVSIRVLGGMVALVDPLENDVHKTHPEAVRRFDAQSSAIADFIAAHSNPLREQGISSSWVEEWSLKAKELGLK
jgi:hypothetical protein